MDQYVVTPPVQVAVPVRGGRLFPVRRVYCVGRNYSEHAREMGHDPNEAPPFFFSKPADALVTGGAPAPYPPRTQDLHHEVELVAAIGVGGREISPAEAMRHVWGFAVGIDLTRRDLQAEAKKLGRPWEMAKGFDCSAPIGELVPAAGMALPLRGRISLSVNGGVRQSADIAEMIWDVPHVIAELSRFVALAPGDLIFTGTPAGVAATVRGDRLEGAIEGIGTVATTIS
jgi:fumarylpyruvate hydrolase